MCVLYVAGSTDFDAAADESTVATGTVTACFCVTCDKDSGDGWFLLRLSLHDPLVPLNIESDSIGGVQIIVDKLLPFFKQFLDLDLKPFGA